MNFNLFLAKKIKGTGLSKASNRISCISVAISICVILIAVAIMNGFKTEIGKRAVGFSGEILMMPPGMSYTNDIHPLNADLSYLPYIEEIAGIESVDEVAYRPGIVKTETVVQGLLFKGVDSLYSLDFYKDYIVDGRLPDFSGRKLSEEIMISERLAKKLGYETGDKMTVYFVGENVRVRRFTITGLFNIQLEDFDEKIALADIRQMRRISGWSGHESSCIEISLGGDGTSSSIRKRDRIYDEIGEIIMARDQDEDDQVALKEIDEIYPSIFDWLSLLDLNVLVVLVLMIAVAGFNMVSGILIILFEKISMIGTLKSMGMRTKEICKVFILRGGSLLLKGMLYGNIAAAAMILLQKYLHVIKLAPENYFVNFVPVDISLPVILLVNVAAFAVMLLIMTIPSFFIAKVSPAKTMRMK